MRAGGGRAKGNAFERHIAKMIVEAFAHKGITQEDCYRTPMSGGHRFACKTDPGDLQMSPKLVTLFPFSVEAKSYRRVDLMGLMIQKKTAQMQQWWKQACAAAKDCKREPLLVFKQNATEPYVVIRAAYCKRMKNGLIVPNQCMIATMPDGVKVRVLRFALLLDWVSSNEEAMVA